MDRKFNYVVRCNTCGLGDKNGVPRLESKFAKRCTTVGYNDKIKMQIQLERCTTVGLGDK